MSEMSIMAQLKAALPLIDELATGQDCKEYAYATGKFFQAITYAPEAFEALRIIPEAISALKQQSQLVEALKASAWLLADISPDGLVRAKVDEVLTIWEASQ